MYWPWTPRANVGRGDEGMKDSWVMEALSRVQLHGPFNSNMIMSKYIWGLMLKLAGLY
jgi:hypothetical protein